MMEEKKMKILHKNAFGHIAKCRCCNDMQLSLGNVLLTFNEQEYNEFDQFFNRVRKDLALENDNSKQKRNYIIKTSYNRLTLCFSFPELENTVELLNYSNIMLSANELTSFYEN